MVMTGHDLAEVDDAIGALHHDGLLNAFFIGRDAQPRFQPSSLTREGRRVFDRMARISAVCLIMALAMSATAASAQNIDGAKYDKGASVTVQGCVVAGEAPNTFVLTGLKEWPVGNSINGKYGPRHYWLDKQADELKPLVGQTVQIRGTIMKVSESEVEREPGGWNDGVRVAIELPGTDVRTTPRNAGIANDNLSNRDDMKITLLKFHVDELMVVMKTCIVPR